LFSSIHEAREGANQLLLRQKGAAISVFGIAVYKNKQTSDRVDASGS
jgi:hypothetical protein